MRTYEHFIELFRYIGGITNFIKDAVWMMFTKKKDGSSIAREVIQIGIDSLPLVMLSAFFIGIIIAFQTAYQLRMFSSEIYIASLVALSLVRELGPVITALVVAARSGAAITAGIGSMKISVQVDALEAFSVNPINYLVVPKLMALLICMPLLVIYADLIGILGGYLVGSVKFAIPGSFYFRLTLDTLAFKDLFSGMLKSFCFGGIIAIICCFEGFKPLSSTDVSRSVTNAVVRSFIAIIIFDCILTAIFYFL
jgi:phospholipid/cholesterol/gamma-HCH transport system permease protein